MANSRDNNDDLYKVLGLKKECSAVELRSAYKKLAMRWHPDRCSASGNTKLGEEAKKKFQAIQRAYSVLSDSNKRTMYDVGVYDSDDDDCEMGEFLNEMLGMMDQSKPNGEESFEKLQELFEEMFQVQKEELGLNSQSFYSAPPSMAYASYRESCGSTNKRRSCEMSPPMPNANDSFNFATHFQSFSVGKMMKGGEKEGKREERRGGGRSFVPAAVATAAKRKKMVGHCQIR